MSDSPRHPHDVFRGLGPPSPPAELRRRILSLDLVDPTRGDAESVAEPSARDLWAWLWEPALARASWAALVVALLLAHLAPAGEEAGEARPADPGGIVADAGWGLATPPGGARPAALRIDPSSVDRVAALTEEDRVDARRASTWLEEETNR